MKKIIITMVLTVAFAFSVQAAEMKIGYVDMNKALNESEKGKKAERGSTGRTTRKGTGRGNRKAVINPQS